MTLTLALPFFNSLDAVKGILGSLKYMTSSSVEWLVIDNGSTDPIETFFRRTLRPKRLTYHRNPENIGMVATYNQIFSLCQTELLAVLHNDVLIYEPYWDKRVIKTFTKLPNLGMAGFFGASGVGAIGERIQDNQFSGQMSGISNLLEAELHGIRMSAEYVPVAILDGFAMIFRMEMIKKAGGLDPRYHYHHLYDRDLPLTSLNLGYDNVVINIPCHHQSGTTANQPHYQHWINRRISQLKQGVQGQSLAAQGSDPPVVSKDAPLQSVGASLLDVPLSGDDWTHRENSRLFHAKWHQALPLYVEPDFSFRRGRDAQGRHFKGSDIRTFTPNSLIT